MGYQAWAGKAGQGSDARGPGVTAFKRNCLNAIVPDGAKKYSRRCLLAIEQARVTNDQSINGRIHRTGGFSETGRLFSRVANRLRPRLSRCRTQPL
jgi:hypothetical protein